MTIDEMLRIDRAVCLGLGKKPGEMLVTAASRALRSASDPSIRRAASALLNEACPDVWERMRRSAELLV